MEPATRSPPPLPNESQFTVPTSSVFRKLRASLFSPNHQPQNPNPNSRPCSSTSAARRLNVDHSEFETSIGSSNYNVICSSPGRTLRSTPHRVPLSDIGNRGGGAFGPVNHRKNIQQETKDKGKQIFAPSFVYSAEKSRFKDKPAGVSTKETNDIGNRTDGVFGPNAPEYRRKNAPERTKDKGKQISLPSPINSAEKTRVKGKQSDVSTEKMDNLSHDLYGTNIPEYRRKNAPGKTKDKEIEISLPLALYSAEKTRVKGKPSDSKKTKDLEMVIPMPISCNSIVNSRNKKKENVVTSSCPPIARTRKKRTVCNEAGNVCVSHSLTASQPKGHKKKRRIPTKEDDCINALPQEYVEQQRAYFKEIDDFELVEEEASDNE